ncbi:MAG: hypothetical protein O7G85_02055 [Planctomycetota bacterium]|nr:hypothetical protein [Planctomycetota bacterium]
MKRLRVILLFLVLGAIVNVAVAWGCAMFINLWVINDPTIRTENSFTDSWELSSFESFGSIRFHSIRAKGSFDEEMQIFRTELPVSSILPHWGEHFLNLETDAFKDARGELLFLEVRSIEGRGWPMKTIWGAHGHTSEDKKGILSFDPKSKYGMVDMPFPVWQITGVPRMLPALPIWRGHVINTTFYAALLWLLIPGPFAFRRMIRLKRGHCMKCNYDLQGSDHNACPECGVKLAG